MEVKLYTQTGTCRFYILIEPGRRRCHQPRSSNVTGSNRTCRQQTWMMQRTTQCVFNPHQTQSLLTAVTLLVTVSRDSSLRRSETWTLHSLSLDGQLRTITAYRGKTRQSQGDTRCNHIFSQLFPMRSEHMWLQAAASPSASSCTFLNFLEMRHCSFFFRQTYGLRLITMVTNKQTWGLVSSDLD